MTPAEVNYKNYVRGDTITERVFTITKTVSEVETPVDLTGASIKCDFALCNSEKVNKELGQGLTMVNATEGIFKIDAFSLDKRGVWYYDIEITFPDGVVKTWIKGSIKIEEDVTK